MDARRSSSPSMTPHPGPLFVAPRPDHVPPEALSSTELEQSVRTLRRKLRSARNALFVTRLGGALLTVALIITGFALLWIGPEPFLERLLGLRAITTTYDAILWWSIVIVVCVVGGALGDQLVRGRLRLARGWRNRVDELRHRLDHAETEQRRRHGEAPGPSAPD
jgi:hypothetical protein